MTPHERAEPRGDDRRSADERRARRRRSADRSRDAQDRRVRAGLRPAKSRRSPSRRRSRPSTSPSRCADGRRHLRPRPSPGRRARDASGRAAPDRPPPPDRSGPAARPTMREQPTDEPKRPVVGFARPPPRARRRPGASSAARATAGERRAAQRRRRRRAESLGLRGQAFASRARATSASSSSTASSGSGDKHDGVPRRRQRRRMTTYEQPPRRIARIHRRNPEGVGVVLDSGSAYRGFSVSRSERRLERDRASVLRGAASCSLGGGLWIAAGKSRPHRSAQSTRGSARSARPVRFGDERIFPTSGAAPVDEHRRATPSSSSASAATTTSTSKKSSALADPARALRLRPVRQPHANACNELQVGDNVR